MDFLKLSLLVIVLSLFNANTTVSQSEKLTYDYYARTCPEAESIIRSTVKELYESEPEIAPALLRTVFHDCFVSGCDASILLNTTGRMISEQKAPSNVSLKRLNTINKIKARLEETCTGVVSCADIVVLAARESVVLTGGPFYPLRTGRMDSNVSFNREAFTLPSPHGNLSEAIAGFASRGFDAKDLVTLLGLVHCEFINRRLNNFTSTGGPDPSLDVEFLEKLRARCNGSDPSPPPSNSPSSSSTEDPSMNMDYEGPGKDFGKLYYQSLLLNKGLLFVDQQLTSSEETLIWVRAYASDVSLFQRDFTKVMIKMSNHEVLTAPEGQIRRDCTRAE